MGDLVIPQSEPRELIELVPKPNFASRYQAMRMAKSYALEAWADSGQLDECSVNPAELAHYYNCEIYLESINSPDLPADSPEYVNSYLAKRPGSKVAEIVVERGDPLVRQRFSIAHEIGHLLWIKKRLEPSAYVKCAIHSVGKRQQASRTSFGRRAGDRPLEDQIPVKPPSPETQVSRSPSTRSSACQSRADYDS